jgi:hypothetical protein
VPGSGLLVRWLLANDLVDQLNYAMPTLDPEHAMRDATSGPGS